MPPPHGLFLGNLDRSSRRTVTPRAASAAGAVAPARPAPTTNPEVFFVIGRSRGRPHRRSRQTARCARPAVVLFRAQADEIGEQLIRAVDARGKLAPEAKTHVQ